jgi:hypothetical protein
MSLKPHPIQSVPEETARVAQAAFPHGTPYLTFRDALGPIFQDEDFTALFPTYGQPGLPPYLVVPDERREKVLVEVNRPTFSRLSPLLAEVCRYIAFAALRERLSQVAPFVRYLKPEFLDDLRDLVRGSHASARQDSRPVLDDRIPLRSVGGVEQWGINQARGNGVDAHRGQLQRQGRC